MDIRVTGQGGQNNLSINNTKVSEINKDVNRINDDLKSSIIKEEKEEDKNAKSELDNAIKKLNTFLADDNTHAEVSIHSKLKRIMVKIIDDKTGSVIMEVPPKNILDLVAKMLDLAGVLVDKKA